MSLTQLLCVIILILLITNAAAFLVIYKLVDKLSSKILASQGTLGHYAVATTKAAPVKPDNPPQNDNLVDLDQVPEEDRQQVAETIINGVRH